MSRALELPLALSSSTHLPCAHVAPLLKGDHKLGTSFKPLLSRPTSREHDCTVIVIVALFVSEFFASDKY